MSKQFHISDVLSVTTGRLLSNRHIEGVYDILNHMTGESLFTHQLPRASRACTPVLLERFPELNEIEVPDLEPEDVPDFVNRQKEKYGEFFDIAPLPCGSYEPQGPIEELLNMRQEESA